MKIVLVGPAWPFRGGIAETTNSLYLELRARGHEVKIAGFAKQFPGFLFPGKTQFDTSRTMEVESNRILIPWNPLAWRKTAKWISEQKPDLIGFKWWMPYFGLGYWGVMRLLEKQYQSRVAFICHNVIPHERRFGDRFLSMLALSKSSFFLTFSKNEAEELKRLFPKIAADRVRFALAPLTDKYDAFEGGQVAAKKELGIDAKKLLLFMGLVRGYKGLDILLRAMPEIVRNDSGVKLVIAGEFYEEQARYDKMIYDLGIRANVMVRPGYVPAEDVGTYLAAADVNVLPYRSATQSGIMILAYAHGCPVIATNVGGLAEVIEEGKTGYVVEPENPGAIATAVKKFFGAGGRAAHEPHVRVMSENFAWSKSCEILEEYAHAGVA